MTTWSQKLWPPPGTTQTQESLQETQGISITSSPGGSRKQPTWGPSALGGRQPRFRLQLSILVYCQESRSFLSQEVMLVCTSLSLLLTFSQSLLHKGVARPGASLKALATDPRAGDTGEFEREMGSRRAAALLCTEAATMLCILPAQRSRLGVTRRDSRCCSQHQPSLEDKLFALTGFTLHQEPAGETHTHSCQSPLQIQPYRQLTPPAKPSLSNTLEAGTSDGLAPARLLYQGLPGAVLRGPDQQCLWLCVQEGGCSLQPATCARR